MQLKAKRKRIKMASPLVSIIMPAFNSEHYIEHALTSVINQTYPNWELLIVDDCSTDNTLKIIEKFCVQHAQIKYFQNTTNLGAAVTRNKAIKEAQGVYIAFLDTDDQWVFQKLEKQVLFMQQHDLDVSFSSYHLMNEDGKLLGKTVKALPVLNYNKLLKCNYVGNLTGMYNAERLDKVYAPNLRKRQDWLMWLKALQKSDKTAMGLEEALAVYRLRKGSISSNKIALLKYNYLVYRNGLKFSTLKSVYYLLVFLYEYFFVKSKQTITL